LSMVDRCAPARPHPGGLAPHRALSYLN